MRSIHVIHGIAGGGLDLRTSGRSSISTHTSCLANWLFAHAIPEVMHMNMHSACQLSMETGHTHWVLGVDLMGLTAQSCSLTQCFQTSTLRFP